MGKFYRTAPFFVHAVFILSTEYVSRSNSFWVITYYKKNFKYVASIQ